MHDQFEYDFYERFSLFNYLVAFLKSMFNYRNNAPWISVFFFSDWYIYMYTLQQDQIPLINYINAFSSF